MRNNFPTRPNILSNLNPGTTKNIQVSFSFSMEFGSESHLSPFTTFLESNSQTISGDGFPVALHFKETAGPGWRISSRNLNVSFGGSTVIED